MSKPTHDRFDDVPHATGRVGAHRAEAPGMNGWVVLLWSVATVLVLVVVGIFGSLVAMGRISFGDDEAVPAATAAPEETGVVDTSYAVLILNATPDDSLDEQMRDQLIQAGWDGADISSSDGSSEDFPETTVYYVEDADRPAALGLAEAVGGAEVQQSDFYEELNDSGGKQLTVVIGVDRVQGASDAPTE